jgi:hypothetical protein
MFSMKRFLEAAMVTFIGAVVVGVLTSPLPPVAMAITTATVGLYHSLA